MIVSSRLLRWLAAAGSIAVAALLANPPAARAGTFVALESTRMRTSAALAGPYHSAALAVDVVLQPSHADDIAALLADRADPRGSHYGQWLPKGAFDAMFGPSPGEVAAVSAYLRAAGLHVTALPASPLLLRATGTSDAIAAALHTSFGTYRSARGVTFFANTSPAQIPAAIAPAVRGVLGLTSTVRPHKRNVRRPASRLTAASASGCQTPYPTIAQMADAFWYGTFFASGYGDGPGCSGFTPGQLNGIYSASLSPKSGQRGAGATLAVYELSGYERADIAKYTGHFYGDAYHAPLTDVLVDGGSVNPVCPPSNPCYGTYSGDDEVDGDIEFQLAIAPDISRLFVYEVAPDTQGLTEIDGYARIAEDDYADSGSTSWGVCEDEMPLAQADAENLIFEQMALQGQSFFSATGDTGAFGCLDVESDGTTIVPGTTVVNAGDPAEPWITLVGGTSFETFNPQSAWTTTYPSGAETVWNFYNLCNTRSYEHGLSGYQWCYWGGASNGGTSQYWASPYWQHGTGLIRGNRQLPDVSAVADEFTPYAEYCAGKPNTDSACSTYNSSDTVYGWFGDGGTSFAAPLWAAIIADRDGYTGHRAGNINPALYELYDEGRIGTYLHDITGDCQLENNNGFFPVTRGYDMSTGLGTPRIESLITGPFI